MNFGNFFWLAIAWVSMMPLFSCALRIVYLGIYEQRIVGSDFVTEWTNVEKVIFDEKSVRVVDATKGAIEFEVADVSVRERIKARYALVSPVEIGPRVVSIKPCDKA